MDERKLWGHYQKMGTYIDFYLYLLDKVEENFSLYIETKKKKYLRQTEETEELITEVAKEALKDVKI